MTRFIGEGLTADLCRMFLVNFAVQERLLEQLIPSVFQIETLGGYGFVSVVISNIQAMRPPGVPRILGRDFDAVVYRVPVRYKSVTGRLARGVYFLRSDLSDCLLGRGGFWKRLFKTNLSFVTSRRHGKTVLFTVRNPHHLVSTVDAKFDLSQPTNRIPESSLFMTANEAVERLVDLCVAFDYQQMENRVAMVPIRRASWDVRIVTAIQARFAFLDSIDGIDSDAVKLDSVFYVPRVPYRWYPPIFESLPSWSATMRMIRLGVRN